MAKGTDRPRWPAVRESGAIEGEESRSGRERASEVAAHVEKELNIASDAEGERRGRQGGRRVVKEELGSTWRARRRPTDRPTPHRKEALKQTCQGIAEAPF